MLLTFSRRIRPGVPARELIIDVRLTDEYGINKYPYGKNGLLNIHCSKRKKETEKPVLTIQTNEALKVIVKWRSGELERDIKPGKTIIR